MWDERKNQDWAPKIFKTRRIQTQKINTNPEISSTNPENQTQSKQASRGFPSLSQSGSLHTSCSSQKMFHGGLQNHASFLCTMNHREKWYAKNNGHSSQGRKEKINLLVVIAWLWSRRRPLQTHSLLQFPWEWGPKQVLQSREKIGYLVYLPNFLLEAHFHF